MAQLSYLERFVCKILSHANVPRHVAFIMDGNRRFAVRLGKKKEKGHDYGFESLRKSLLICQAVGIKIVTLFAFALQNFDRPKEEVEYLMNLVLVKFGQLSKQKGFFESKQVKVKVIGDRSLLSKQVLDCFQHVEQITKDYNNLVMNICFSYNSDYEISTVASEVETPTTLQRFLDNLMIKDHVDIIVRTSNQIRLSNFLTIQSMRSQICFLEQSWPQMSIYSFLRILLPYHINYQEFRQQTGMVEQQIASIG